MVEVVRAIYRGYWSGGKRAGQVKRLHIIREEGPKGWAPGKQTLCGQAAWHCQNSDAVIISPLPTKAPEGLTWCPHCMGRAAELLGMLDEAAAMVAGHQSELAG